MFRSRALLGAGAMAFPASLSRLDSSYKQHNAETSNNPLLEKLVILSGTAHPKLATDVCQHLGISLGNIDLKRFADGEVSCVINESVRGKDVFIIQSCAAPVNDSVMELLITVSCARRAGAKRIIAVIPYFGYRHHRRGSPISTKHSSRFLWSTSADFAKMLKVAGVDRVISVDLQRPGQGQEACFFDPSIPVETVLSTSTMVDYFVKNVKLENRVVIVAPDSDCHKRARKFQRGLMNKLNLEHVGLATFIHTEHTTGPSDPNASEFLGDVTGADVIIVDDIVDTGGTLSVLCHRLRKEGAKRVFLCASHGIFTKNSTDLINLSPVVKVLVTDTLPLPAQPGGKIEQVSVVPLIAKLIESEFLGKAARYHADTVKDEYILD